MSTSTMVIFSNFIIIIFVIVIIHEAIHLITGLLFHRSPRIRLEHYIIPNVYYANNNKHLQTLTISLLPSVILVITGILLQGENIYITFSKIILELNFLNFFPITTDGEVALYAIIKLIKEGK